MIQQICKRMIFLTVDTVTFIGGEPLFHENMLMTYLDKIPNDKELHFVTNGSVSLTETLKTKLLKYKKVVFCFSVDGTGSVFEYMRYPLKWDDVTNNIQELKDLFPHNSHSTSITISNMSLWNLPELYEYVLTNINVRNDATLIEFPEHFSPANLPDDIKAKVSEHLQQSKYYPFFRHVDQFMNNHPFDEKKWEMFGMWTKRLDDYRGQDVAESLGEYGQMLKDYINTYNK